MTPISTQTPELLQPPPRPARRRLRRSDCAGPGIRRVKRGKGFSYLGPDGQNAADEQVARIRELAIPPAWQEVWICVDELGHLQATGIDGAGRKQYLYHSLWRERRDRQKFERMLELARALPAMRRRLDDELAGEGLTRERVLACAVRMLDIGLFRIGGERYADDDGGLGLATIRREHVHFEDGAAIFDYPAKSGVQRVHSIADPRCVEIVRILTRRRGGEPELLAYRQGRRWLGVDSLDINRHLKELLRSDDYSAKDFRTWNATVLAAMALADEGRSAATVTARKRHINRAVKNVSLMLGNTPAVARRSYIDPKVFDRYLSGWTVAEALMGDVDLDSLSAHSRTRIETAVIGLLEDPREAPAVDRMAGGKL